MEASGWKLMSKAYYIIPIVAWFAVEGESACFVTPPAVSVIAGDYISLACTTDNFIIAWTRGITSNNNSVVFQAASSGGGRTLPKLVVGGYLVNDSVDGQVVLIMNSTSSVQADRYYCFCSPASSAATVVTVLVSKPTMSTTNQITDGGPVTITCSISLNGTADASVMITNGSGQVVAERLAPGSYPTSRDLRIVNLDYNDTANSSIIQTYTCQLNLTDNSVPVYSQKMMTSVQWVSVKDVQINPVDKSRCFNGSKCAINQAVNCSADGNPYPVLFQWTVVLNGSQLDKTASGQLLVLESTGNYTINCTAFNMIQSIAYNGTSGYFKTEVTDDGPPTPQPNTNNQSSNTPLIIGVVVGVGGGIIVIVSAILIYIFCIRNRKSSTVCCKPDDKETQNISQSVELSKTPKGNNRLSTDNGAKKNGHTTPGVQNKGFEKKLNDEVTLVENDLYSAKSKPQIDPSDGGYASVNEIESQGK